MSKAVLIGSNDVLIQLIQEYGLKSWKWNHNHLYIPGFADSYQMKVPVKSYSMYNWKNPLVLYVTYMPVSDSVMSKYRSCAWAYFGINLNLFQIVNNPPWLCSEMDACIAELQGARGMGLGHCKHSCRLPIECEQKTKWVTCRLWSFNWESPTQYVFRQTNGILSSTAFMWLIFYTLG